MFFFFSSRRRHTRLQGDWSSDVCSSDLRGADMALVFSGPDVDDGALEGFESLAFADLTLYLAESPRHGAPMTMVRAGEERDLAAIAAMGRVRADAYRFHLDRDVDLIQYA